MSLLAIQRFEDILGYMKFWLKHLHFIFSDFNGMPLTAWHQDHYKAFIHVFQKFQMYLPYKLTKLLSLFVESFYLFILLFYKQRSD